MKKFVVFTSLIAMLAVSVPGIAQARVIHHRHHHHRHHHHHVVHHAH